MATGEKGECVMPNRAEIINQVRSRTYPTCVIDTARFLDGTNDEWGYEIICLIHLHKHYTIREMVRLPRTSLNISTSQGVSDDGR